MPLYFSLFLDEEEVSVHVCVLAVIVKGKMLGDSNDVTAIVAIWSQVSHKADLTGGSSLPVSIMNG